MRLRDLPEDLNRISGIVFDAAIEVQRLLGDRLAERVYRDCLAHELRLRGLHAETEYGLPLHYKDLIVPEAYFVDVMVEDRVVVELKCVPQLGSENESQLLTYLHLSRCRLGLLFNFHAPRIKDDYRRFAFSAESPA
jgi:GxxExxY protein